jgi:hypothetical protein
LFAVNPGAIDLPDDGYGWMDDEQYSRTTLENGVELEIFTRNMGFAPGEAQALV